MQVEIRADKKSMTVGGYVNVVGRDSRVLHDKVVDIKYDNSGRHYTVELQTASQYLGDVTQYQEQIAELESAAAEKDSTITAQASTIQSQESQIESQTATIQEQATTIQELREAGTAAELETGLDAAYEEGVNSVE